MKNNYETFLSNRAKEMRANPTKSEQKVKDFLIERKIPYKSQKVIMVSKNKGYIVDFLLWKKIILEVDGSVHESKEAKDRDSKRTSDLMSVGYKVIRLRNDSACGRNIKRVMADRFTKLGLLMGDKLKSEIEEHEEEKKRKKIENWKRKNAPPPPDWKEKLHAANGSLK